MIEAAAPLPAELVLDQFVLRRYQQKDAAALAVAVRESLEHLRPWMPWIALEPTTLKERKQLLSKWDRDFADGTQYSFGMFRSGRVVGGAGLMRRIASDGLEIGYWVHADFVGRGFATTAAEALTTLGSTASGASTAPAGQQEQWAAKVRGSAADAGACRRSRRLVPMDQSQPCPGELRHAPCEQLGIGVERARGGALRV